MTPSNTIENPAKKRNEHLVHATILGISAALCYSVMTLLVKVVSPGTTESMTVFFRFTISLLWVMTVLGYKKIQGKHFQIKTKHFGLHITRALASFIAMFALYYSLKYVTLVKANALAMTYTLFIPVLGAIFLRTKTSLKNWLALVCGFIGIIFILKPFGGTFNPKALMALISGIAIAVSFLGVYELAKEDKPYTIMLYYFPLTFVISGIFTIFSWKTPDLKTLGYLLMIGIVGTAYQDILTRALVYAPPKTIAPLLYISMIFSTIFDWLFWHNIPHTLFWFGAILVVAGCILSIRTTEN